MSLSFFTSSKLQLSLRVFLFSIKANNYCLIIPKLSYTHLIPSPPTALQGQGPNWKIQATWAGLQPDDQSCVLQNVVGNAGNEVGHWHHIPSFYDGATKPSYTELYFEDTQPEVYPGDEITSTWTLDTRTNKWLDTWSVMPGPTGSKKGEVPYGGNYTFDGSKFNPKVPDMTEVLLMIEHLALPAATASFPDPGWHSGPRRTAIGAMRRIRRRGWSRE
ncbi:hypothetical protein CJF30_00007446 [Rutstroemia sp. NJR-2017a BBW]|nr:hypothetical protein CJF30_00007446 [Rutstroemia sp. NJR-2017a BBW]